MIISLTIFFSAAFGLLTITTFIYFSKKNKFFSKDQKNIVLNYLLGSIGFLLITLLLLAAK